MDKREDILEAALELFAERGFYGTPVPLIAERAGVGAGTIYRYFESKEGLVNALYQKWKQEMYHIFDDFPEGIPTRQMFREGWRRQVEFVRNNPLAIKFLELHHHASYLDDASCQLSQQVAEPVLEFYKKACQEQLVKNLPAKVLVGIIQSVLMGIMKTHWQGQVDLTPELIEQIEEICWQAIRR
jgi:AcrR family transcriptional regulator